MDGKKRKEYARSVASQVPIKAALHCTDDELPTYNPQSDTE